jgi:anthranilate synthase component 2
LLVAKETCPDDLEVTAWTEDGSIMAMIHKQYPHIQGVQFHPESIITQNGKRIVGNWVKSLQEQEGVEAAAGAAAAGAAASS